MQTIVVILGTGGYQCRPIGPAQTRTVSTARRSLGLAAAIMSWLTGSPWVPNDPNKYTLYSHVFDLLLLILFSRFVPSEVPMLIGDVHKQLPTIMVVKVAPLACECPFNCVCASAQAWDDECSAATYWPQPVIYIPLTLPKSLCETVQRQWEKLCRETTDDVLMWLPVTTRLQQTASIRS